jgi:hypothetical protein
MEKKTFVGGYRHERKKPSQDTLQDQDSFWATNLNVSQFRHLPSEPVVEILMTCLEGFGPFSVRDNKVIIRTLSRLKEIEDDEGLSVAMNVAAKVGTLFGNPV